MCRTNRRKIQPLYGMLYLHYMVVRFVVETVGMRISYQIVYNMIGFYDLFSILTFILYKSLVLMPRFWRGWPGRNLNPETIWSAGLVRLPTYCATVFNWLGNKRLIPITLIMELLLHNGSYSLLSLCATQIEPPPPLHWYFFFHQKLSNAFYVTRSPSTNAYWNALLLEVHIVAFLHIRSYPRQSPVRVYKARGGNK